MFLLEPGHTPYDLRWRMFGIDVRVHPMFWLLSAILGFGWLEDREHGIAFFLIWIGCVFISMLVHELGHVFMFRACGTDAHIVLYAFGGVAIPYRALHNRWKRIAVSLAGPLAQLLIVGVITIGLVAVSGRDLEFHPLLGKAITFLAVINLFWALFNLLPIYPLDGGHISRDLLDSVLPAGRGVRLSLGISLVLAGLLTVHCLLSGRGITLLPFLPWFGGDFNAIMFAMLAVESFQLLQQERDPPWRREG